MQDILVLIFLIIGTIFIFVASIGLLKMPDVYLRMSASTIAATFGVASMLIAVTIHFGNLSTTLHIAGVILFLVLTVPIGAHMLGRSSHIIGIKKWDKTVVDEMEGKYNEDAHDYDGICKVDNEDEF